MNNVNEFPSKGRIYLRYRPKNGINVMSKKRYLIKNIVYDNVLRNNMQSTNFLKAHLNI